jgi:hypothetical protein
MPLKSRRHTFVGTGCRKMELNQMRLIVFRPSDRLRPPLTHRMRFRPLLMMLTLAAASLRAQDPLNPPIPLSPAPPAESPGDAALTLSAAQRAQELGMPSTAVALYRQLLAVSDGWRPPLGSASSWIAHRSGLSLALATALLDDGQPAEAETALKASPGPRGAAWHLRAALAAAELRRTDEAGGELEATRVDELGQEDVPWLLFLKGITCGMGRRNPIQVRRLPPAGAEGRRRTDLCPGPLHARLRGGPASRVGPAGDDALEQIAPESAERFAGTATGYDFVTDLRGHACRDGPQERRGRRPPARSCSPCRRGSVDQGRRFSPPPRH